MATGRERAAQAQQRQQGFLKQAADARARAQRAALSSEQASRGGDESGLITGPINRRRREAREGEALTEQSAAFEALGQQRAQSILQASGADFDKVSPDIAGGITELLAYPETRDQGIARLEQVRTLPEDCTSRYQQSRINSNIGTLRMLAGAARWLWNMRVTPWSILLAVGVAVAVGVV